MATAKKKQEETADEMDENSENEDDLDFKDIDSDNNNTLTVAASSSGMLPMTSVHTDSMTQGHAGVVHPHLQSHAHLGHLNMNGSQ